MDAGAGDRASDVGSVVFAGGGAVDFVCAKAAIEKRRNADALRRNTFMDHLVGK